jgi:hypothetical protein
MESRKSFSPTAWLRRLECGLDGWAAKKLTPEELAEAQEADARFKRNFWRLLAMFLGACGLLGLLLFAIKPRFGIVEAMAVSTLLCFGLLICFASAFYGYRKFMGPQGWRKLAGVAAMAALGAATGMYMASRGMGKSLPTDVEGGVRLAATAVLVGLVLAVAIVGVARLRKRGGRHRGARLKAEAEHERSSRQTVQAELKLLQAQVEPHFLFNTLANLRFLVQTGSPDALAMLDHLIRYLRMALPEIRAEASTVEREVELARAYLEILRIRMGGALEILTEVEPDAARAPLPALMVMTLVENAIKHGVAPRGRGRVTLRAGIRDGVVRVSVEDDGRGLAEPIGRGVGLANIRERLRALYGEAARLDLASGPEGGAVAAIELPERAA